MDGLEPTRTMRSKECMRTRVKRKGFRVSRYIFCGIPPVSIEVSQGNLRTNVVAARRSGEACVVVVSVITDPSTSSPPSGPRRDHKAGEGDHAPSTSKIPIAYPPRSGCWKSPPQKHIWQMVRTIRSGLSGSLFPRKCLGNTQGA